MQCTAALQQQIGFGPASGAPEMGQRMGVGKCLATQQVLQHESFPTCAAHRMAVQRSQREEVEQMVQQPRVAQLSLGAFTNSASAYGQRATQKAEMPLFEARIVPNFSPSGISRLNAQRQPCFEHHPQCMVMGA